MCSVCECGCVSMCEWACVYMCTHECSRVQACVYMHAHMCICEHACVQACMYMCAHVSMYMCVSVRVCEHVSVHVWGHVGVCMCVSVWTCVWISEAADMLSVCGKPGSVPALPETPVLLTVRSPLCPALLEPSEDYFKMSDLRVCTAGAGEMGFERLDPTNRWVVAISWNV